MRTTNLAETTAVNLKKTEKAMKLASIPGIRTVNHGGGIAALVLALTMPVLGSENARADDDAVKILKSMSDYVAAQKAISVTYDADIEVITNDLEKIQFTNSGALQMVRPDKIHVSRIGGYSDVELVFDGAKTNVLGHYDNVFTEVSTPGSIEQLVDRLRDEFQVAVPGADLLMPNSFDRLMDDVIDAKHVGVGVVDGVECEHLAFRDTDVDWQIWVEMGAHPIPHKYIITSKHVTGAPQYTLRIKTWVADVASADAFVFKAPADAKKVDMHEMHDIDEVPSGVIAGGKK